jgi:hypothetical protein
MPGDGPVACARVAGSPIADDLDLSVGRFRQPSVSQERTLEAATACARRTLQVLQSGVLQDVNGALDPRLRGGYAGITYSRPGRGNKNLTLQIQLFNNKKFRRRVTMRVARLWSLFSVVWIVSLFPYSQAEAIPSFARQTGAACSQCHVQSFGPNLTPQGRQFKLQGYTTASPGQAFAYPPISAMVVGSFTHTDSSQPGGAADGYSANNNFSFDQASLFYGGRILPGFDGLGAFVQLTYDGIGHVLALDNTDIRLAHSATINGNDVTFGISLNNNPTSQDLWNTTPAWGFPFASSPLAPTPAAASLVEGNLAGQVGGATAYMMLNDFLFLEAGAYASLSHDVQRGMGTFASDQNQISGSAPYWRIAFQNPRSKHHYFAVGAFGLKASVFPGRDRAAGTNTYADMGADWTYQYFSEGRTHIAEFKGTYIHENQDLAASLATDAAANQTNILESLRFNAAYTFAQTYGVTAGYFKTWGTRDAVVYAPGAISGSANGMPDSEGFIAELNYVPFGKKASFAAPWANIRFALQYTAYSRFNGGSGNYDGSGRNARDNDTLFVNGWLTF